MSQPGPYGHRPNSPNPIPYGGHSPSQLPLQQHTSKSSDVRGYHLVDVVGGAILSILIFFALQLMIGRILDLITFIDTFTQSGQLIGSVLNLLWFLFLFVVTLAMLVCSAMSLFNIIRQKAKRSSESAMLVITLICTILVVIHLTWTSIQSVIFQLEFVELMTQKVRIVIGNLFSGCLRIGLVGLVIFFTFWTKRHKART